MQRARALRRLLQSMVLAACCAASTSFAQINLNISLAPPAPQYEAVPALAPGYTWAPGYWTWHGERYIWIRGRTIAQRTGYRWDADRWENRDGRYFRQAGRWERDAGYRVAKVKKDKRFKHGDGEGHGKGHAKHGKHG